MTRIDIGSAQAKLNTSKFLGEKSPAVLFSNGNISVLTWSAIEVCGTRRYVVFTDSSVDGKTIYSAESLKDTLRDKSIFLINCLARAVSLTLNEYPDLTDFCGCLPLSAFYFTSDGDVILFPKQLSDITDSLNTDSERFTDRNVWKYGCRYEKARPLCWLCSLVYYSVCSNAPYISPDVRETGNTVPLSLICQDNSSYISFVDSSISMPIKKQYAVKDPFGLFIEQTDRYIAENREMPKPRTTVSLTDALKENSKKAKIHSFIRCKGHIVITISAASALLIWFIVWFICNINEKPVTYRMSKNEIVQFYYDSQNTLNAAEIDAPFARMSKCPVLAQVTALYVSRQTRLSYEGKDPVISAEEWKKSGMGSIPEGCIVYGYTDLSVTECPDGRIKAESLYYTSQSEQEINTDIPGQDDNTSAVIEEYSVTEYFTFTDIKGYYQITAVDTDIDYKGSYTVELRKSSTAQRTELMF